MSLPPDLTMRAADERDLPTIAALRESVGWSTHGWALRAVLRPCDQVRCVAVTDEDDRVVAIGSGVSYGHLGFVGNMIVAPEHRRRGVGSAVLAAILAFLERRGCTRIELFATSEGRPLYERHGFRFTAPSAMAIVPRGAQGRVDEAVSVLVTEDTDELSAYDAPRFGGDRRFLLEPMAQDPDRPLLVARRDRRLVGYLWLRTDGHRAGPFLADSPEIAATLMRAAFEHDADAEGITLNPSTANRAAMGWLEALGVEIDPWDGRMARGAPVERREETIYASTVGALG